MIAQLIFLPSIMLSGIMFPIEMLPKALEVAGQIVPTAWGFRLTLCANWQLDNLWVLLAIFLAAAMANMLLLKKQGTV